MPLLTAVCFCASVCADARAAERADFVIVEKLSALSVFDRYEQPLSPSRRDKLPRWAPLCIVENTVLLGDQITEATHVRLGTEDYYLLRDEKGGYVGEGSAGRMTRLRNCEVLNDTVTVARDNAIVFVPGNAARGRRSYLPAGTVVVRSFRHRGRSYCLREARGTSFGWCEGASSAMAQKKRPREEPKTGIPEGTARRVRRRFEAANDSYRSYFEYFNTRTKKGKSAPRWVLDETPELMRFTLKASAGCRLDESTRMLVREIESIAAGDELEVERDGDIVEVRMKGK